MPLLDLSLPELHLYQGRNPKPKDFDEYWDRALSEMKNIDPDVKLKPGPNLGDFVKTSEMTWSGMGGSRIYAKLLEPTHPKGPTPAVIHFHGYSMDSGDWSSYLGWVASGFTVAAMDVRGQGGKSEDFGTAIGNTMLGQIVRGLGDSPEKMHYRSVFCDAAQLAGLVIDMRSVDSKKVSVTGWSQGGGLTLACASLEPRIHKLAPVYPFLTDYQRVWEMDLAKRAYDELRGWLKKFDPRHQRIEEVWNQLGYIDTQHLANRIRGETLMLSGLSDDICPPSTQFAAYNKINSKKDVLIYPDFGHEGLPNASDLILQFITGVDCNYKF